MPAITLQTNEIQVTSLIQVHLHAIDDRLQMFALEVVGSDMRCQGLGDRMTGIALQHGGNFLAPPEQLGAGHVSVGNFVNGIIDFPAKRIQCGNGTAPLSGQEQKAVVKAGAALGCLLLAIVVRRHEVEIGIES